MSDNRYPRETSELIVFEPVTVNGIATTAFTYQLQREGERPTNTWQAPVDVAGELGFLTPVVTQRGTYVVWVRVVQGGQSIVIEAGEVVRT